MSKKGRGRIRQNQWRRVYLIFGKRKEDRNVLMPVMSKVVKEGDQYKIEIGRAHV